jgi:hypothetical protein
MKEFQALIHNWEQCIFMEAQVDVNTFLEGIDNNERVQDLQHLVKTKVSQIQNISNIDVDHLSQYVTPESPDEVDMLNYLVSLIANNDEDVFSFVSQKDFYLVVKENQQKYLH